MISLFLALALGAPSADTTEVRALVNPLPTLDREARQGLRADGLVGADVRVQLSLDADGRVAGLEVSDGPDYVHASVAKALGRWEFESVGEPIELELGVRIGSREPEGTSVQEVVAAVRDRRADRSAPMVVEGD